MRKLLFFLLFLKSVPALAILAFEDAPYPEFVTSARALAMGNAFLCLTDDAWAAFYNPAGLGSVRDQHFHLTNLHLEMNKGFFKTADGDGGDTISNLGENFSLEDVGANARGKPGYLTHGRINFYPNILFRYFSLGYFYSNRVRSRYLATGTNLELAERTDRGPVGALNLSLFGGVFKIGASLAWLTRKQVQVDFADTDAISVPDSLYEEGSALITTVGTRLTMPIRFLPTFSFVMRNAGSSAFEAEGSSTAPADIPTTYDAGFSIQPILFNGIRLQFEVNYRDTSNQYDLISKKRKIGAGMEIDFVRRYFIRFGWGDGFGSAGIGVRTERSHFDFTTYAYDTSVADIRGEEDRRFVLSFAAGF